MSLSEIEEKAQEAELEFRKFMDEINIPYLPISNEMGKFSSVLKALLNSKRPDYLLLLGKAGMLPVDVKYKNDKRSFRSYMIDCEEVERYLNFSNAFGIDVWYAISNRQQKYATWYWLSINDIQAMNFATENTSSGKCFIAPKKELIKVSREEDNPLTEVVRRLTMLHS